MRRQLISAGLTALSLILVSLVPWTGADESNGLGDVRSFQHMSQEDIVAGRIRFEDIVAHGKLLFDAPLTRLDGQGRPATTGAAAKLFAIRDAAKKQAARTGLPATLPLSTKGVAFGSITANPDGALDTSKVYGVDRDLIIKPFHQKGVVRSVREFTVNAFNHHHGMQAVERFGIARTGTADFDGDGVEDE